MRCSDHEGVRPLLEFRLLGEVELRVDGVRVDLGPARQRCVLVSLLVDVDELVSTEQVLERVWAGRRPQRVREALYTYVSRLRGLLTAVGGVRITRRSGGYLLAADPGVVDLHRFRSL